MLRAEEPFSPVGVDNVVFLVDDMAACGDRGCDSDWPSRRRGLTIAAFGTIT